MNDKEFCTKNRLDKLKEIDKVAYLAFYVQKTNNVNCFSVEHIVSIMINNTLCNPNIPRLRKNIRADKRFMVAGGNMYSLRQSAYLDIESNCIYEDHDSVESNNEYIDESLFLKTPEYMIKLIKQINSSYKHNLFDAAAVLIRRVFENLLIKSYEKLGISDVIKNKDGNYLMLEGIITDAISNTTLNLSRCKNDLRAVKDVGNFAAHRMNYNTNINDLNKIKEKYRLIVEELLYKSGLK